MEFSIRTTSQASASRPPRWPLQSPPVRSSPRNRPWHAAWGDWSGHRFITRNEGVPGSSPGVGFSICRERLALACLTARLSGTHPCKWVPTFPAKKSHLQGFLQRIPLKERAVDLPQASDGSQIGESGCRACMGEAMRRHLLRIGLHASLIREAPARKLIRAR
jgi:hypothetical protein